MEELGDFRVNTSSFVFCISFMESVSCRVSQHGHQGTGLGSRGTRGHLHTDRRSLKPGTKGLWLQTVKGSGPSPEAFGHLGVSGGDFCAPSPASAWSPSTVSSKGLNNPTLDTTGKCKHFLMGKFVRSINFFPWKVIINN